MVGKLSELAAEVTEPPVRLVKTIGDAAMLVSPEPRPLVEAALWLVEAVAGRRPPGVRAGIAFGTASSAPATSTGTRSTSRAGSPGSLGPTACYAQGRPRRSREGFDWSFAGRHRLKGIGESVPVYRARPRGAAQATRATARKSTEQSTTKTSGELGGIVGGLPALP